MVTRALPTGAVTFLFTDIEGSTILWQRHRDAMRTALAEHDRILHRVTADHHGTVFKTAGDAFCCAFAVPQDAVAAAVDAQRSLHNHPWRPEIGEIRVRMGIHTGTAEQRESDYFGPTMNRVARLMSIGHGGQILVSSASALLLRDVLPGDIELRDLGAHRLKDLKHSETTYQVLAAGLRADFPALLSLDAGANNLPSQISSFVGRVQERKELRDLISANRLVTIVGPGGIGKTRLALHVAAEMLQQFPDGAWLVELAAVNDPALITQTISASLNVREAPQEPMQTTLLRYLAEKELLLLLDNSEHLLAGSAGVVKSLIANCPRLTIAVTSREPLHIIGEIVYRVASLTQAPAGSGLASLEQYDSPRLFLDRARAVCPQLAIGPKDGADILAVCRKVEGIPLAIELAAARVSALSIAELNTRLQKILSILVSPDSTESSRHRTLRGTIDWSYQLLTGPEQTLLRSLSVFDGGFDLDACERVLETGSVVDQTLQCLVEKSLVVCEAGQKYRYRLLDIVQQYACEKLLEAGEHKSARDAHFRFYESLAAEDRRASGHKAAWLDAMQIDIANVRAALQYALEQRLPQLGLFLSNVAHYWQIRGHITEGRSWFSRFLAYSADFDVASVALVLRRASTFATIQDEYADAMALSHQAHDAYVTLGDPVGQAESLHAVAAIEHSQGDADSAAIHYGEAADIFRQQGQQRGLVVALINLATIALGRDDISVAEALLQESETLAGTAEDADIRSTLLSYRGLSALRMGDAERAAAALEKALDLKIQLGDSSGIIEVKTRLAAVRLRQGKTTEAQVLVADGLAAAQKMNAHSLVIEAYETLAHVYFHDALYEEAATCLRSATSLRNKYSYRQPSETNVPKLLLELKSKLASREGASTPVPRL